MDVCDTLPMPHDVLNTMAKENRWEDPAMPAKDGTPDILRQKTLRLGECSSEKEVDETKPTCEATNEPGTEPPSHTKGPREPDNLEGDAIDPSETPALAGREALFGESKAMYACTFILWYLHEHIYIYIYNYHNLSTIFALYM